MKKIILTISLIMGFAQPAWAELKVVTSTTTLGALATAVGGTRVKVKSLAKAGQDVHFLLPKPSFVVALNRADLFVSVGMDMEVEWLPVVLTQSRNPKVQPGRPGYVNASIGIRPLQVPVGIVNRARGDIHALGNPHYDLDPNNGAIIAQNIFDHLVQVDPEGETYYQARLYQFNQRLQQSIKAWQAQAVSLRGSAWVSYHLTWTYLADWLGLNIVAQIESLPGVPPSAKHLRYLTEIIPQNKVRALLSAPYYPRKVSKSLSEKNALPLKILPAHAKGTAEADYFNLFEGILLQLK